MIDVLALILNKYDISLPGITLLAYATETALILNKYDISPTIEAYEKLAQDIVCVNP